MKRFTFVFCAVLTGALFISTTVSALVLNGDFETGNFGSWTKSAFINNGMNAAPGGAGTDLSAIIGGPAVAPLSIADARSNGLLRLPAYGHYSARVNDSSSYTSGGRPKNANRITQDLAAYIDPADNLNHVRFAYAAVMVNPASSPHTNEEKPYFRVRAYNVSRGNDLLYDFSSFVNEPGKNWQDGAPFSGADDWKYLNWTVVDLTPTAAHPVATGDTIRIEVTAAGCSLGGHPGYAYVDEITDHEIAGPTVKAVGPANAGSGSAITYTYNYRNGAAGAVSPTISVNPPVGVTFTSVSNPSNCSLLAGSASCSFAAVPSGGSGSFTITGNITASTGSQIAHGDYSIAATGFPTAGGQTVLTNVADVSTTTSVTSSVSSSRFGQNVRLTATVAPAPGGGTPTGSVQFVVDGSNYGSPLALSGGQASIDIASLPLGGHSVVANYSGAPGFTAGSGSLSGGQTVTAASTTTSVVTAPNPSVLGQSVSLTATVDATAPGAGTPTGAVQFIVDGANFGAPVTLSAGTASFSTSSLAVGSHTVGASFSSAAPEFANSSGTLAGGQLVNQADTNTAVNISPNPSVLGQSVTITATVNAASPGSGTPTGTVQFIVDGANFGNPVALSGGTASLTTASLSVGNHTISASYSGAASSFTSSSGALAGTHNVLPATTSTMIESDSNPSASGQSVTFTAKVAPISPGSGNPTGAVQFLVDGTNFGSPVALAGGTAVISTSSLAVGNHPVTANYLGTQDFDSSSGALAGGQSVNQAGTVTSVGTSANPSVFGQSVTFTATVAVAGSGSGTPGGAVQFVLDGANFGSPVSLSGGTASISASSLTVGNHLVTANYSGAPDFASSGGSLTGGQTVNQSSTSTSVGTSVSPSVFGQNVTFTATIAAASTGAGTPGGTVQFVVDGANFGSPVALSGGSASISVSSLAVGNHPVTANYSGAAAFAASSGSLANGQTVNRANTVTTVGTSANPSFFGQSVTITATVAAAGSGTGTPVGTVQFVVGGANFGSPVTLSDGTATINASSLSVGNHPVTATYSGTQEFAGSSGSVAGGQTVNRSNTTTSIGTSPSPSSFGQNVTMTAIVGSATPGAGTPIGTVQFVVDGINFGSPVALSGGTAAVSTASLPVGIRTVAANFSGSSNFNASSGSLAGGHTVYAAGTAIAVSTSPNPSVFGQRVTLRAVVAAVAPGTGTPTGSIQFVVNGSAFGSPVALSDGAASMDTTALHVGGHNVAAVYTGGTGAYAAGTGFLSGTHAVNTAATATTVSSSPNPSVTGQSGALTATVAAVAPGGGMPAGMVQFSIDGVNLGPPVSLIGGAATISSAGLPVGNRTIAAVYIGNGTFTGSSGSAAHVVNKASSSVGVVSSKPNSTYGEPVTFTATVVASGLGTGAAGGSISFSEGQNPISGCQNLPLNVTAKAQCTTTSLPAGSRTITVVYSGDASFTGGSGTASQTVEKANLQVTASSHAVTFGAAAPSVTPAYLGFVLGQSPGDLQTAPVCSTAYSAGTTISASPVATNCAGGLSGNYNFQYVAGTLTITKAELIVTAPSASVTYGDTAPSMAPTYSGFVPGYAASDLAALPVCSTQYAPGSAASATPYSVTCSGGSSPHYSFVYRNGEITVGKRQLTVAAEDKTRAYGSANPGLTVAYSGFALGQTFATSQISGFPGVTTTATPGSSVGGGPYPIVAAAGTLASNNYSFAFVNGNLRVEKALLTVKASDAVRPYGTTNPAFASTMSGFVNGETLATSGVTGVAVLSTAATPSSPTGTFPLHPALGSLAAGNYSFAFTAGTLKIEKVPTQIVITNADLLAATTSRVGTGYFVNWRVNPTVPGVGTLSGDVTVSDGAGGSCTAPVAAGTCELISQQAGERSIAAAYPGDTNHLPSVSAAASHPVMVVISGRIRQLDLDGTLTKLAGVSVYLAGAATQEAVTNENGEYVFGSLASVGDYVVTPRKTGFGFAPSTRSYAALSQNVTDADFIAGNGYTPTASPTPAASPSPTGSPVSTVTPTPATTPGPGTPTPTPSTSPTVGPTPVPSVTPTTAPTPAPSATPVATATPTPVPTASATVTPTPAPTASPTPSGYDGEGDVIDAAGTAGGGDGVNAIDLDLVRQFVVGLASADTGSMQFQHGDTAPRDSAAGIYGDGLIDSSDATVVRLYSAGMLPGTAAAGPVVPEAHAPSADTPGNPRVIRAVSVSTRPGETVTMQFVINSMGNESSASFTVAYDESVLSNPLVSLGQGVSSGTVLTTNGQNVADGKVGVLVDSLGNYAAGTRQVITIRFNVSPNARIGLYPVKFEGTVAPKSVSSNSGILLPSGFEIGYVQIGSTAAGVSVGGRVTTSTGQGLRNATVVLADSAGIRRTATTGSFGYYRFDSVEPGRTYVVSVASKRYRFTSRFLSLADSVTDFDLIGQD